MVPDKETIELCLFTVKQKANLANKAFHSCKLKRQDYYLGQQHAFQEVISMLENQLNHSG